MRKIIRITAIFGFLALFIYAGTPYLLPSFLKWFQPGISFRGDASRKVIYLTIDDAPTTATDALLAVLAKHKVSATFFIISGRVKTRDDLERIVKAGHQLGHHMRTTTACSKLSWDDFKADFDMTDGKLQEVAPTFLFRPPSDFGNARQLAYARNKGYTPVLGTIFPLDHWLEIRWLLGFLNRWLAIPGGILIMHDGAERGARTATVLDNLIPDLKAAGYEFGALSPSAPAGSPKRNH